MRSPWAHLMWHRVPRRHRRTADPVAPPQAVRERWTTLVAIVLAITLASLISFSCSTSAAGTARRPGGDGAVPDR